MRGTRRVDGVIRHSGSFLRLSHYSESRNNGTPLQINDTAIRQIAAGTDIRTGAGSLLLRGYGSDQDYHQTFSAIAPDRNSERLTVDQRVPSSGRGGSVEWFSTIGRNVIVAGGDARQVKGASDELQFAAINGKITHVRCFRPAAQRRRVCRGRGHALAARHAERRNPFRFVAQLRRAAQRRAARRPQRRRLESARHAARSRFGSSRVHRRRVQILPRADAERALSQLPRRQRADARERIARRRASVRDRIRRPQRTDAI